jgi:hypothetical protein
MPKVSEGTVALGGLAAIAIWLLVALPFLYGPPSRDLNEQKNVISESPNQAANTKPDGSARAPFVVQVMPGPKSAEQRSQVAEDREEKKSADRWLMRWTAALFAATVGLILATGILGYFGFQQSRDMKASIAASVISANAAKAAAEALPAIESSYVFLRLEQSSVTPAFRSPGIRSLWVKYNFINHGKTPAVIQEIRVGIKRLAGDLPVDAWAEQDAVKLPVDVLGTGESFEKNGFQIRDPEKLTDADADLIIAGGLFIYFFGNVSYQDVFGNDRETQFCWRFNRDRFEEWGGNAHNHRT